MESSEFTKPPPLPHKSFPWGCVLSGCLGCFLLLTLGLIASGVGIYYFANAQFMKYTAEAPRQLPIVAGDSESLEQLSQRVESLQESLRPDQTPQPFFISADEINSVISQVEDIRGKVFVRLEDGKIMADVSLSLDQIPGGSKRYFNGTISVRAMLEEGKLNVHVVDGQVNGEPIPETVIAPFRQLNLAKDLVQIPELAEALKNFDSLIVDDGQIILTTPAP